MGDINPIFGHYAVAKQVPRSRIPRERFDKLLAGPDRSWRIRHVEMNDPSALVRQNQENEEHAERCRWDGEEINRDNILGMVCQERSPILGRRFPVAIHVLRDSGLADLDAEFE